MALFKSTQIAAKAPIPTADRAVEIIPIFGDFTVPAGFAANDVVEMVPLPAGYVPVDLIVDGASLGATVTGDVGIVTGVYDAALDLVGAARNCGAEFIAAAALGTAGLKRTTATGATRIAPVYDAGNGVQYNRSIGFKATAVTTPTVGAAIRFTLLCRPAINGA
jgi:hypothetical protein